MKKGKVLLRKIVCCVFAFLMIISAFPQSVQAANYQDTGFLNFAMDANGLVSGYVVSIDGKTDFEVQNGCVVLEGGFTHRDIPIQLQLNANSYYDYCIAGWSDRLNQYNDAGVDVNGELSSNEIWNTWYPKTNTFEHNGVIDLTLMYGPYANVHYPVYGKRTIDIIVRRVSDAGEPEGGGVYRLPLLFVAPKENVSASASIYQNTFGRDIPILEASWKLGSNSNIAASYQWYEKVNGNYTKIEGATGASYTPTKIGDYKVDIVLEAQSTLSGVETGTYTAAAETTVSKADSGARIGWNGTNNASATVTLNDAISLRVYAYKTGKFVIRKENQIVKEQLITADATHKYITMDMGAAKLPMAGEYTWEFIPEDEAFCQSASGRLNLTVNKLQSNASASMSEYIGNMDYKGSIRMKADVPGTYTFATAGRSQQVPYVTAGSETVWEDLSVLIPSGTAVGTYKMEYRFTPDNAEDYAEATGSMDYTVDEAKCDLVVQQASGGTVKVDGKTDGLRASVGQAYEIVVTPDSKTATYTSDVDTITVNGEALEESVLRRRADGSVSASYTVPSDGTYKTYTISATYKQRKLVLKSNQPYYHDSWAALSEKEDGVWAAVVDTVNSIGIERDEVTITYYQGINKDVLGNETHSWAALDAYAINIFGGNLHAFGSQDTEKVRISVNGTDLSAEINLQVLSRTYTWIQSNSDIAIAFQTDKTAMYNHMVDQLNASVADPRSGITVSDAILQYTDPNGNAIDWSLIKAGDVFQVKIVYDGIKTSTGGYSPCSKLVDVFVRPDISVESTEKTYTGSPIVYAVTDFTAASAEGNAVVTVTDIAGYYDSGKNACEEIVDAGQYYVKLELRDSYGTFVSDYVPVRVNPAELTIFSLGAKDRIYDATQLVQLSEIVFNGIIDADNLAIDTTKTTAKIPGKQVGSYQEVTLNQVVLSGDDAGNYKIADAEYGKTFSLVVPVIISQKEVTIEGTAAKDSKEYDGNVMAEIIEKGHLWGQCEGDQVEVKAGIAQYADKHVGQNKSVIFEGFALGGADSSNYRLTRQPAQTEADITAKEVSVHVVVNEKQFNGSTNATIREAKVMGTLPEDDVTLVQGEPEFEHVGDADREQTVNVSFTEFGLTGADAGNYELVQPTGVAALIYNRFVAEKDVDYVVNSNDWINEDFTIKPKGGYLISTTSNGTFGTELSASEVDQQGLGSISFYVKDDQGDISGKVVENYKIDKQAPTGTITFGEHVWSSFSEVITAGIFVNEYGNLRIDAEDDLSGVKSISYFESERETAYTLEELAQLEETVWTENNTIAVSWEEAFKYVYYVRIMDHAGNATYLCSADSIEYDITKPAVTGVEEGGEYYTTMAVTVSDRNLKIVTLDGEEVQETFSLAGNVEKTYVIRVTDKAGNTTAVTVAMKPIASLDDSMESLTEETVTSADEEALKALQDRVAGIDTENATEAEKQELETIRDQAHALLEEIDENKKVLEDALKAEKETTSDSYTQADKEDLEKAAADLEQIISEENNNYTEAEKEAARTEKDRINDILEAIEEMEAVVEAIIEADEKVDENGDATAIPDSEAAVDAVISALDAYNKLDDRQRELMSEDAKQKLDEAVEKITAYKIIKGAGGRYIKDTSEGLAFTANGLFKLYKKVKVDGAVVDSKNYTAVAGSTVVTLKAEYLQTLDAGSHTLDVIYEVQGKEYGADCKFLVENAPVISNDDSNESKTSGIYPSNTGDHANAFGWMSVCVVSLIAVISMWIAKKKYRNV